MISRRTLAEISESSHAKQQNRSLPSTPRMWFLHRPQFVLVSFALTFPVVTSKFLPSIQNSFVFLHDPPNVAPPFPVTEQCQNINFTIWRQDDNLGPPPVPPYFLHIYTSTFIVPFIVPVGSESNFIWQVPFVPGTLFQICMLDSVGNSGGCRGLYSIIPARGVTAPPTCPNVTFPAGAMDVVADVIDGRMSQYGWIPQCSDIALTPRNGTAPYTFRILPSHLPLFTITSSTGATVNWTISLGRSVSFFVAVYDSVGNSWTNGPLRVGKGKRINAECFGVSSTTKSFPLAGTIGTTVSGLVLGVLVAYLFTLFHSKAKRKKEKMELIMIEDPHSPPDDGHQWHAVPNIELDQSDHLLRRYQVEPFAFPDEKSRTTGDHISSPPPTNTASYAESSSMAQQQHPPAPVPPRQVYVVHHDAGRVPGTVYTPSVTLDEELPPDYPSDVHRGAAANADPGPASQQPPSVLN